MIVTNPPSQEVGVAEDEAGESSARSVKLLVSIRGARAGQEMQSWRPARPASSPSEQTDRLTPGRGVGDDSTVGGKGSPCGGNGWHSSPGGSRVDGGGPRNRAVLGGLFGSFTRWQLNHSAFAELRDGSLALPAPTGMASLPISRECCPASWGSAEHSGSLLLSQQ